MTREESIECLNFQNEKFFGGQSEALKMAISALSELGTKANEAIKPYVELAHSVSAENKGEWIAQDIHNCCTEFKCSKCGYVHNFMHLYGKPTADYSYCPNCGADMRGKADETNENS